jgi:hypothetical protein
MPGHSHLLDPVLINTVGHTAGILLFGFIIVLITRDWRNFGVRQTRLSLLAAYLALGWNAGSLTALASNGRGPVFIGLVMTASFAILSLLPAVLLQVFYKGVITGSWQRVIQLAPLLSFCTAPNCSFPLSCCITYRFW